MIGPFIGGLLQKYFGWKANFVAFGVLGIVFVLFLLLFIHESIPEKRRFTLQTVLHPYFKVLAHRVFVAGIIIGGLIQTDLMIYPTLAPFIVENTLHYNFMIYSNTALLVGCGYLGGTLVNRLLLKRIPSYRICDYGFGGFVLALISSVLLIFMTHLTLFSLIIPILLINFSSGFIYPNILGANLKLFPQNAGIAMATQVFLLMLIATCALFIISHFHIINLLTPTIIYALLIIFKSILFFKTYRPALQQT